MYNAFISYAHVDETFVSPFAKRLMDNNYKIWWDTISIPPGEIWRDAIKKGIRHSQYFLLVVTEASLASLEVTREIRQAVEQKKSIIPIVLDKKLFEKLPDTVSDHNAILFQDADDEEAYSKLQTQLKEQITVRDYQTVENLLSIYRREDDTTFGDLEEDWIESVSFNDKRNSPVGLLVGSSLHRASAMLWGRRNEQIRPPEDHPMQVYLHFTGKTNTATFDQYTDFIATTKMPLWTLYIRGPYSPADKVFKLQDEGDDAYKQWQDSAKFVMDSMDGVKYKRDHWAFFLHTPNPLPMMLSDYGIGKLPYDIYHHREKTKDPERYYIRVHHHDPHK